MFGRFSARGLGAVVIAGALATAAGAAPAPAGHDLMLAQLIRDAARGETRYQTLTPELAAAVRGQAGVAQSELTALGELKSIGFVRVNAAGQEIYRVVFEKGALDWAFAVDAQGLISNAIYRPVAPAPP